MVMFLLLPTAQLSGTFPDLHAAMIVSQLLFDGLCWSVVRYEDGADGPAPEQDCSGYCVAGPITDNRDGTLTIKMGSYTQLEKALRELEEALT